MDSNDDKNKKKYEFRHRLALSVSKKSAKRPVWMLIILLLVLVLMSILAKCSREARTPLFGSDKYPAHSGGDTLDIAIEITPLGYNISGDTISGIDYDIIRDLSRIHHRPVKLHPFAPLDYALGGLDAGAFDIVVSSLQSTTQLKGLVDVTEAVYIDRYVMVSATAEDTTATAATLGGDTVWIPRGSPVRASLVNLGHELGDTIYINDSQALTTEHLLMLTAAGRIRRAVVAQGEARIAAAADPRLHICAPVTFNQFQVWAVAKNRNDRLLGTLNHWLTAYKASPRYAALLQRYRLSH